MKLPMPPFCTQEATGSNTQLVSSRQGLVTPFRDWIVMHAYR